MSEKKAEDMSVEELKLIMKKLDNQEKEQLSEKELEQCRIEIIKSKITMIKTQKRYYSLILKDKTEADFSKNGQSPKNMPENLLNLGLKGKNSQN